MKMNVVSNVRLNTNPRTRQWLQSALLIFLGLYFLDTVLSGRIAFYINYRFEWLAVLATAVFLLLGVLGVVNLLREPAKDDHHEDCGDNCTHDHAHDHEHDHAHHGHNHSHVPGWLTLGMVTIPLALGILVPSRPLGASAVGSMGLGTGKGAAATDTTTLTIAPEQRNVLDWMRAFYSTSTPEEFVGQPVDVVGFVYRDIRLDTDTEFMAARYIISCCVADAAPAAMIVRTDTAADFEQDTWVRVRGRVSMGEFDGQPQPIIVAESIEVTDQPDRPYLYP
jgi:putative membrane protein